MTRDLIIHKGRRVRWRRRFALGGGILSGVAVLAAVAVLVPGLLRGGGGGLDVAHDPYPYVDQPAFPFPEMDPDLRYRWGYQPLDVATDETRAIDAAWLARIRGIEDAEAYSSVRGPAWPALTDENYEPVLRDMLYASVADADDPDHGRGIAGYEAPVYQGGRVFLDFGAGPWAEQLSVAVYPKGFFLPGAGQPFGTSTDPSAPFLVAGCEDYTVPPGGLPATVDYTCAESGGPNGERVLTVDTAMSVNGAAADPKREVVLYRTDGTAVVLTDQIAYMAVDEPAGDRPGIRLGTADLVNLALSIPPVLVR